MMMNYEDFTLTLNGVPGSYTVEARGPGQIAVPPEPFLFNLTPELQSELDHIASGVAPSRQRMQGLGERLFTAFFPRRIIRAFGRAYDELPAESQLRLKLVIRPAELNVLPWELLYDVDEGFFLAARLTYPLVRYIESTSPIEPLESNSPLRLLYIQSLPADQVPLDLAASEQAIRQALQKLGKDVEIVSVHQARPADLRQMLRQDFHILHYDGHAFFDEQTGSGSLVLQDAQGLSYNLPGELFASFLDGSHLRLVVLAACQSAMDSPKKRFSGIAHQIMKSSSLPAVVAMQYSIDDASAIAFHSGFYGALADHFPVDAAVVEGRKAILERFQGDAFATSDWATPVLFLRTEDGNIFKTQKAAGLTAVSGVQVTLEKTTVEGDVNVSGRDIIVGTQITTDRELTPDGPPLDGPSLSGFYAQTSTSELKRLIRQRVSEDKLEDALKYLLEIDDQASLQLQDQLKRLKNDFLLGTLTRENFTAGRARIASTILQLI